MLLASSLPLGCAARPAPPAGAGPVAADRRDLLAAADVRDAILAFIATSPEADRAFIRAAKGFVTDRDVATPDGADVFDWGPWFVDRRSGTVRLDADGASLAARVVAVGGRPRLADVRIYTVRR